MNIQQKKHYRCTARPGINRSMAVILAFSLITILLTACAGDYARKRAETYYLQGQALVNRGETDRAIKKFEKSIYLSEKTGFEAGVAHNLNELAIIHTNRDQFETARAELTQALEIYRSLEMNPEISKTMNNIIQSYRKEGRFEDAIEHYKQLIVWDEKTDNRLGMAFSLWNMALIYEHYLGDHEKARTARNWSLEIFQEPGNEEYLRRLQRRE